MFYRNGANARTSVKQPARRNAQTISPCTRSVHPSHLLRTDFLTKKMLALPCQPTPGRMQVRGSALHAIIPGIMLLRQRSKDGMLQEMRRRQTRLRDLPPTPYHTHPHTHPLPSRHSQAHAHAHYSRPQTYQPNLRRRSRGSYGRLCRGLNLYP